MVFINVVLEIGVAELVAGFKLAVVIGFLLHGVVRQMDHPIRQVM